MRRIIKALFRFLLVIIPLIVIAVGAGMLWLSRSLAPLDGDMTIDGLSGPVTITRDEHGVPHIKAATRADAAAVRWDRRPGPCRTPPSSRVPACRG